MLKENKVFSFGKNWQFFLKHLNEDRVKNAEISLADFMDLNSLKDKSFLDIGCGSGLFSYAAYRLGAKSIVSFDADPFSVACCKYLKQKADMPAHWQIFEGSILDKNFISSLGMFDIVYAWGVLHHTGKMWDAISNSASLVNKGGYYYIAIYNKAEGILGSELWLKIKRLYNLSSKPIKYTLITGYIFSYLFFQIIRFKNPIQNIKNYASHRGMDFLVDVFDWLGGYPYEFASIEDILKFIKDNFPEFILIKTKKDGGMLGNNWFLFKRDDARHEI